MINPSNLKISLYLSKKSSISAPNIPNNPLKKSGTAFNIFNNISLNFWHLYNKNNNPAEPNNKAIKSGEHFLFFTR